MVMAKWKKTNRGWRAENDFCVAEIYREGEYWNWLAWLRMPAADDSAEGYTDRDDIVAVKSFVWSVAGSLMRLKGMEEVSDAQD